MDIKAEEEAFWTGMRRKLAEPPSEEELARVREFARRADELRVKVGRHFNVVDEVRKMRGGWDVTADA